MCIRIQALPWAGQIGTENPPAFRMNQNSAFFLQHSHQITFFLQNLLLLAYGLGEEEYTVTPAMYYGGSLSAPAQIDDRNNSLYFRIMNFTRTFLAATNWPPRLGLCLLLLALVLRGIVPAGYMPKQTDQGYALAFCLPSGQSLPPDMLRHWAALLGDDVASHSDEATTSATCPFCVMLQAALTPTPVAVLAPLSVGQSRPFLLPPLNPALAQAFIRGPPVGQRAPPTFLPA